MCFKYINDVDSELKKQKLSYHANQGMLVTGEFIFLNKYYCNKLCML